MLWQWLRQTVDKPARSNTKHHNRPLMRLLHIETLENRYALSIVAGGDGTQNTTAPLDDPGFANVGACGSATAIYLGDGWVLTAAHVGANRTEFNGVWYDTVANSVVQLTNPTGVAYTPNTDLIVYQIAGRPDLPSITIGSDSPAVGWNVIMVGNGRDRATSETYWTSSWTTSSTPAAYAGYGWVSSQHVRWGTNVIYQTSLIGGVGVNSEKAFNTMFTGNTPSDAQGATGDSGGAVFHKNANGSWELIGVMFSISYLPGQPQFTSAFGDLTYSADLSAYRTQILQATKINHAPVGTSNAISVHVNTAYTFTVADFGFSDPQDIPSNLLSAIEIASLPSAGTLTDDGVAVTTGQFIAASDIVAGKLRFTPATNASGAGYAAFTFQVQDDGGTVNGGVNLDPAPKTITINVTPIVTYSLWPNTSTPAQIDSGDAESVELGVKFTANTNGYITGIRYYKSAANTGVHTGSLWSAGGQLLATATFTDEGASGWQQVLFATPVAVTAGVTYVASYHTNAGHFSVTRSAFTTPFVSGPLTVAANGGVFLYGAGGFPSQTYQASNYWVDVLYSREILVDITPPQVTGFTPPNGTTDVVTSAGLTIAFSEALNPATVNTNTVQLLNGGTPVAATVTYNATLHTVTLKPTAALTTATTYTIRISGGSGGIADLAGNVLAANVSSSFTTVAASTTYSLWANTVVPAQTDSNDGGALEAGVKFTANADGYITGIRYYKSAANTGVHTGSLWSAAGQLLATATFTSESTSGWQQVLFSTPVAVTAGTIYVASYHTNSGHFAVNRSYFTTPLLSGPLTVPANGGVFLYGAGGFPTQSYQASNYWVDVVYSTVLPLDTTPPTVTGFTPANNAANVPAGASITIAFSEALSAPSVNSGTVQLLNGSVPVAVTVSYNAATKIVTLTPTASLGSSATYTIRVVGGAGGVKDLAGNALAADATSSFTTIAASIPATTLWSPNSTPSTIDSGDAESVELGVKFTANTNGYITGIRYYKSAANTGVHTGSLWSASGQLLATATFIDEGTSGWQQVLFATPVAVTAGVTYVASYHTNAGHFSVTRSAFTTPFVSGPLTVAANGGVFLYGAGGFPSQTYQASNYWVDVLFVGI